MFTSQGWWSGGCGGSTVYCASEGGVVSMSRGMARAYGPHRITVNTVSPGQVAASMLMTGLAREVLESMTADTPLGRVAGSEGIAGVVVFVAGKHAGFVSGATLNVSGALQMY